MLCGVSHFRFQTEDLVSDLESECCKRLVPSARDGPERAGARATVSCARPRGLKDQHGGRRWRRVCSERGALPIDIPFAKTVGASPEPHAEPFLPSARTRADIYNTHTHTHTHTHSIGHAVQTGSSNAGFSPRARTRRPCGLSTPRSPPLWRRSALIALASPSASARYRAGEGEL